MKPRPLWPLLPPAALLLFAGLFYIITKWLTPPGTTCGFRKLTGLHCPGCGGTRSARDLAHGNFLDAISHNALLTTGLTLFLLGSAYLILRITILGKKPPRLPEVRPAWLWSLLGGILLFTILRNIPAYPFTILAP